MDLPVFRPQVTTAEQIMSVSDCKEDSAEVNGARGRI